MQRTNTDNTNRIYLIGYMAAGKTTIGKKIAQKLGVDFIDLDELIGQKEQSTISEIFNNKGEAAFRKIEKEVLESTLLLSNIVISCGGGTPCFFDNMDWMNANGTTLYLKTNAGILASRLITCKATRPIIASLNDEEIVTFVAEQLNQRTIFYDKAKICYDTMHDKLDDVVSKLTK